MLYDARFLGIGRFQSPCAFLLRDSRIVMRYSRLSQGLYLWVIRLRSIGIIRTIGENKISNIKTFVFVSAEGTKLKNLRLYQYQFIFDFFLRFGLRYVTEKKHQRSKGSPVRKAYFYWHAERKREREREREREMRYCQNFLRTTFSKSTCISFSKFRQMKYKGYEDKNNVHVWK